MSQPSEAPPSLFILRAVRCFGLLLGSLILLSTVWQSATLLLALGRHPNSPSCWLRLGGTLPIIALCLWGAVVLLRGRTAGYFPLYLGIVASMWRWGFPLLPFFPGWPTLGNVLILFLAIVTPLMLHSFNPAKNGPSFNPARSGSRWKALFLRGGSVAALLLFFLGFLYWQVAIEREAGAFLEQGIELFEENRDDEAFQQWQLVIQCYPYTSNWGAALYNCGWVHQKRKRPEGAITFYEQLLNSDLDDRDPSPALMSPYQNYHHRACLGLSECHEELGNLEAALRFARLAQDTYPFQSWCFTCALEARQELRERIEHLEQKVNGQ